MILKTQKSLDFLLLIANYILPQFCHIFHLDCCVIFLRRPAPNSYSIVLQNTRPTSLARLLGPVGIFIVCLSAAALSPFRDGSAPERFQEGGGKIPFAIGLRPKSFGPSRKAFSQGRSQPHFETNSLINTSLKEERRETVLLGLLCVIARPDKSEGHKTSPAATPRLRPQMKK